MEGEIEVLAAPDLSDFSRVGGVRLLLPGWPTIDLTVAQAHRLIEQMTVELYRIGSIRGTV